MKILAALLAESVSANPDGTFNVERGGLTDFYAQPPILVGRPFALKMGVMVRLEAEAAEVDRVPRVIFAVYFENERIVESPQLPVGFRLAPNEPRSFCNVLVDLRCAVPRPGRGFVEITVDDARALPLHFAVRPPPPGILRPA
ncbi:MAG: hypothetical protein ACYCS9_05790 [Candidatus Dormibacteria bacterium]